MSCSGGKDSTAALAWAVDHLPREKLRAVFFDTGWEHEITYRFIDDLQAASGVTIERLSGGETFAELAIRKGRIPSFRARFCSEALKKFVSAKYMRDRQAEGHEVVAIIGVRRDESPSRAGLSPEEEITVAVEGTWPGNETGKAYSVTYDVFRPLLDWTAEQCLAYAERKGWPINPLYREGMKRVGCFPCVMVSNKEFAAQVRRFPEVVDKVEAVENAVGSSFFRPGDVPGFTWWPTDEAGCTCSPVHPRSGRPVGLREDHPVADGRCTRCGGGVRKIGKIPTVREMAAYVLRRNAGDDRETSSCESVWGLCE